MQKYWAIGLNKTGTSSLAKAMKRLGFTTRGYPMRNSHYDAYEFLWDLPIMSVYPHLDKRFPNSKFIYTIRDLDSWLVSCQRHFMRKGRTRLRNRVMQTYGVMSFDTHKFAVAYFKHDKNVKAYFKDRPNDLLTLNICDGDTFDALADFVGRPHIKVEKIHKNVTDYGNERFAKLPPITYVLERVMEEVDGD